MTKVIMLQGDFADQMLEVAAANASQGITDGWCIALDAAKYPWPTPSNKKLKPAASYDTWVNAGRPSVNPVSGAIVLLTKTNPAVLTLSAPDFAKFVNGDQVKLSGTTVTAINGQVYVLANGSANTFTLTGLNLSGQAADLTAGTVTKVN
jgi:hypothetical protein